MPDNSHRRTSRSALPRPLRAFDIRNYRLLWSANSLYYASRWMQLTVVSWLVLQLTDSPWRVALVGFFGWGPMLVIGLFGGVLADSVNRPRLLLTTITASFVSATAMTVLSAMGLIEVWHLYLAVLITGAGWALDSPSRRALTYDIFGRQGVANAVALDSVAMSASKMVGPALAGALIAGFGVTGAYVAISLSFGASVSLVSMLDVPSQRLSAGGLRATLRGLIEGFRYVSRNSTIAAVVVVTLLMNLLLFPYAQMVPVIARDVLGVGPGLMGIMLSAEGLGAATGAVVIASSARIASHGRFYLGGSMLALLGLLVLSLSRWYALSLPTMIFLGVGLSGFSVMQGLIVMLASREDMRGRALGVMSLAIGASPLGSLMVGAVASARSPSFAIGLNASLGMVALGLVAVFASTLVRQTVQSEDGL